MTSSASTEVRFAFCGQIAAQLGAAVNDMSSQVADGSKGTPFPATAVGGATRLPRRELVVCAAHHHKHLRSAAAAGFLFHFVPL